MGTLSSRPYGFVLMGAKVKVGLSEATTGTGDWIYLSEASHGFQSWDMNANFRGNDKDASLRDTKL